MSGHRRDKLNTAVAEELASILREVKDPRVAKAFVSISGAEVAPDLSTAKVFYSVLGESEGVDKGIASANGFIRSELAKRLNLRVTPKLNFVRSTSIEEAMKINRILKEIENGTDNDKAGG
ncbi:MAG: 30S ribosome-binding factor RbfA [Clostridia bacterium]|nr:30S ribosome-binding factor RbfA [Clostridia bacterium]